MRYELNLIQELCCDIGLVTRLDPDQRVEVELGQGAVLCFQNADRNEDCLIGFQDTPWHTHDLISFYGGRGYSVELSYLDLLTGLVDGQVLVCEQRLKGQLVDRFLIHRDYNDEFKHMEEGEEFLIRRVVRKGGTQARGGMKVSES